LIHEFESGKENWAYSCDPETGKIVPGVINWAGITRRNAQTIKLTLDNGESLIVTPDHKIPVFGKGFVEAKDILPEDSLIAFNTRYEKISGKNSKTTDYQQVWDHESKSWVWTHRMVGEFFRKISKHQEFTYLEENIGAVKTVIHHKDYNRYNNDPRNLTYMNKQDHFLYHAAQKKEFWENMNEEYRATMGGKISESLKNRWKYLSDEDRLIALYNIRKAQQIAVYQRKHDPEVRESYKINAGIAQQRAMKRDPKLREIRCANMEKRVKYSNQKLNLPFRVLQILVDIVRSGTKNKILAMKKCEENDELMNIVRESNQMMDVGVTQNKINVNQFGNKKMDRLLSENGYKNWKSFVKEINNFNHKVVKIEKVENRDVGTITIDGTERWHDYHTFAIEAGIFIKNSINEDYFFPHSSDGRGSSVETLPGGQNLGSIDDLKYFNNKMARGLRVPSSYLPTGPDDSDRAMEDGRVGTALIQEYRFNQYCERLQNLIMQKLDDEFKMFMKWRGFNIDSGLFNIKFNPPQNFASYRQTELDSTRIAAFVQLEPLAYMSKRFLLERYLGLTREEMLQNEKMWREEKGESQMETEGKEMRSVGATPGSFEADSTSAEQMEIGDAAGFGGAESMEMAGGGETTAMAGAPPPAPGPVV
jgi:intein/homing endonuclease